MLENYSGIWIGLYFEGGDKKGDKEKFLGCLCGCLEFIVLGILIFKFYVVERLFFFVLFLLFCMGFFIG